MLNKYQKFQKSSFVAIQMYYIVNVQRSAMHDGGDEIFFNRPSCTIIFCHSGPGFERVIYDF